MRTRTLFDMRWMFKNIRKFIVAFFLMTIVCSIIWEVFVYGRLYYCSDPLLLDFLTPGDWVHEVAGHPVTVVQHVAAGPTNGFDTDTIKAGWSVTRLWHLWYGFVFASLVISIIFSQMRWVRRKRPDADFHHNHAV